jgi:hypothetical protein
LCGGKNEGYEGVGGISAGVVLWVFRAYGDFLEQRSSKGVVNQNGWVDRLSVYIIRGRIGVGR